MNTMELIKIGTQTWMIKNLNIETFRNGEPIPEVKSADEWESKGENGKPAWCYYDNDPSNGGKFGKLYNWHAVNDYRGLAPMGWKIPSKKDWNILIKNLRDKGVAGNAMKSTELWLTYGGTNESEFNGLPGGIRTRKGMFGLIGETAQWWSSTEADNYAVGFDLSDYSSADLEIGKFSVTHGNSVRCIKEL